MTRNGPKRVIFEVYYDFLRNRRYELTLFNQGEDYAHHVTAYFPNRRQIFDDSFEIQWK